MQKTILGFDSWTAGSRHFARLAPALEAKGYRLILVHIGSWGHDKGRPAEETISGMQVRDISYYRGKHFDEIIKIEKPACVLFLSTRAFAHMAFLRYAKHKGIPSCHLYHGLVRVQDVDESHGQAYRVNPVNQLGLIVHRFYKNITRLVPAYARSLIRTEASRHLWYSLAISVIEKICGRIMEHFLMGTETDIGCVYTQADVSHMESHYRIPKNNISVVGNPDLISFRIDKSDLAAALETRGEKSREVLYIDTALVPTGLVFTSNKEFTQYLLAIRDSLAASGYRFAVKLHPAQLRTGLPEQMMSKGFELCDNHEFKNRLLQASAVITEPSSAAMIPALLGLPLFLSNIGPLAGQRYGEVLTSYPLARHLHSVADFTALLEEINSETNKPAVLEWIQDNSGPLPASEMPVRVAVAIDQMVQRIQHQRTCAV